MKHDPSTSVSAVVCLSGGLDSCVALATLELSHPEVSKWYTLSMSYGQRHVKELAAARKVAYYYDTDHFEVSIGGHSFSSALTDKSESLPAPGGPGIPRTYVPGRNTIILALAQSLAESKGASFIAVGFNILDYSGYPDCRPEFVTAWNVLSKVATAGPGITVYAPLIHLSKKEIILEGVRCSAPLHLTWSCYAGTDLPCGKCDSCVIRSAGFADAKVKDRALYA